MTEKVCPRCGSMYEDLKSTTCPQCFAKLLVVDEATAEELRTARESVERTPEFQAAKTEDDERFREQSFGACLGVLVITLVTIIVAVVLIASAVRRQHHPVPPQTDSKPQPQAAIGSLDVLTPVPVAAASLDDVLPTTVGRYKRVGQDRDITLAGTLTHIFHAVYTDETATIQVYAVPTSLPTPQQNQFRQGIELAAQIEAAPTMTFATEHWRYAAVGPPRLSQGSQAAQDNYRTALAAHFRELSQ